MNKEYKFPDNNKEIEKLNNELEILNNTSTEFSEEDKNKIMNYGKFDNKLFNRKASEIIELNIKKRELKDKIRLIKMNNTPLDYNKLTIDQIKIGYINDIRDMFYELYNMKNIFTVLNKNYRRLTLLFILLILLMIIYLIYNII